MLPAIDPLSPWLSDPQRTSPITLPSTWSWPGVTMSPVTTTSGPIKLKVSPLPVPDGPVLLRANIETSLLSPGSVDRRDEDSP
jgi:hypothetical protein